MSEEIEGIPLPTFDNPKFANKPYFLVVEFSDEKRRRDRTKAVKAVKECESYICLMTRDHRLLHRAVFSRVELARFQALHELIASWATPRYFIRGYEAGVKDVLRGVECFASMGETCNTHWGNETKFPSYLGCPRLSLSLKYMHPKAWYTQLYEPDPDNAKIYVLKEEARDGLPEPLRQSTAEYSACPLIDVAELSGVFSRLPRTLEIGAGQWKIGDDLMGNPSLQPKSKRVYEEILKELKVGSLACSDRPEGTHYEAPTVSTRRRAISDFSWLDD